MRNARTIVIAILVLGILLSASWYSLSSQDEIETPKGVSNQVATAQVIFVEKAQPQDINDLPLQDNPAVYWNDDPASVVTMYITVRKGNPGEKTDNTWEYVNQATKFFFTEFKHVEVPKAEVILQVGDESGPLPGELGYGDMVTNGTIQIRGNSASLRAQKSYKIKLKRTTPGWRGQYTIALNKHVGDPTRAMNKLNFDLLKTIPNLTSLRTQFVHLYVKDETADPPSDKFVDYGLFTQTEQPNKTFLRVHQLDPNAQFYKAIFFEFMRYPEEIHAVDDPEYSGELFETRLEIKGNPDNRKLIRLLDDINNPAIPIEETFSRYFNAENYFTWMAYNILVGSTDTEAQNFFLYSPENSQRWYFLPWDYDDALSRRTKEAEGLFEFQYWEEGISTYWGSVLHRRVLINPDYRDQLDRKVEELRGILTRDRIVSMMESYRGVVEPFLKRMPDQLYFNQEEWEIAYREIPLEIENNYRLYKESLVKPMPFFLSAISTANGNTEFIWSESYDFNAEDLTYNLRVSRDFHFETLVIDTTSRNTTKAVVPITLEPGDYFWQVIVSNQSGYRQYPFDRYIDADGLPHNGMARFTVTQDGKILTR